MTNKKNIFSQGFFSSNSNAKNGKAQKGSDAQDKFRKQQSKIKVIIIGNERCGKTSVINRYCHNTFNQYTKETMTQDYQAKTEIISDSISNELNPDFSGDSDPNDSSCKINM